MPWDNDLDRGSAAYRFASDESKTIRVVAGPGTGKSFGLKRRVARLLEQGQNPKRILAVTFTRTAAKDLKKEIASIGIPGAEKVVAKTLHSFCFGLLQKKDIIASTGRYPRPMLDFEQKPMLYDISNSYGDIRKKQSRLRAFEAAWARLQSEPPGFPLNQEDKEFEKEVILWLRNHRAMLFGEMITEAFHYLRDNPMCNERRLFDHILVDEYQDLNKAEQSVIDLLSSECNLAVIGDDDQSIYSFKYANPEGIREFPQNHADCNVIDFDQCRRCPKQVVAMASRLISHNNNRTLGDLHAFDANQDGNIKIVQWKSLASEIDGLSDLVSSVLQKGSVLPKDILILVPVGKIGYRIRDALVRKGINAKSYFRESALSSAELKYNYELLALSANPRDMVALRYLLGDGSQTFRASSYKHLYSYALENNLTTIDVLSRCLSGELSLANITSLKAQFSRITEALKALRLAAVDSEEAFIDYMAKDESQNQDFRNLLQKAVNQVEADREEDIDFWLKEVFSNIIENISYPDDTSDDDHVRIMSLHASKGLSAKFVIVMSAVDGLIPRADADSDIEEQRRLFYVAITRCKSSDKGYPGTLIISSFVGLPGNEALEINLRPSNAHSWRTTRATRFIREFEETAPATILPR